MRVRPENLWKRLSQVLRQEVEEDFAAILAEVIHEIGTRQRAPSHAPRRDLHPP
jgi:hypothetical protein